MEEEFLHVRLTGKSGLGKFAKVSVADFPLVARFNWYFRNGYALSNIGGKEVRMHRFIMQENDPNYVIDHINKDRLDNRRSNLRRYTLKENANNRVDSRKVEAWGEIKTVAEWVEDPRCEVGYDVLLARLRREVLPEYAILAPAGTERKYDFED